MGIRKRVYVNIFRLTTTLQESDTLLDIFTMADLLESELVHRELFSWIFIVTLSYAEICQKDG